MQALQEKFLQLIQSPDKVNIDLALEIAKDLPTIQLDEILQDYQQLYP